MPYHARVFFGFVLAGAIFALGVSLGACSMFHVSCFMFPVPWSMMPALAGTTASSTAFAGNATPSVTALTLNNASSIILIANTTKTVTVSFTISDNNGCSDVFTSGAVTTTVFRSGISSTCAVSNPSGGARNYLNCYVQTTTTYSCVGTSTSANATTSFDIYYFAEATDASSSFSAQNWAAYVTAMDASGTTNATTSAGVELLTLTGLNVETSSLNYGTVNPGTDTSSTNQIATVKNAGNSSTTLSLNGTAMTSGANSIATTSQHYATNTFTYGGAEQSLQGAPTAVGGFSIPRPPLAVWGATAPNPNVVATMPAVQNNGFIYSVGGFLNPNYTSATTYAQIGATGTLGAWATTTAYPNVIGRTAAVVNNNFIYVFAGTIDPAYTSTVRYSAIGTTGTIGAWATTTAFPNSIGRHVAAVNNGYVYVMGGTNNDTSHTTTVRYAQFGATGTLGTWATTTAYPNETADSALVVNNGFIYSIGGDSIAGAGGTTSTVRYAAIGATGTLGSWATTTAYPSVIQRAPAIVDGGIVYVIAGMIDDTNNTSTVNYAAINADGSLGSWAMTTAYPHLTRSLPAVVYNGIVYTIGGCADGTCAELTSTVRYSSLASRNTYWGFAGPAGSPAGTYNAANTFTAVFQP